MLLDTNIFLEVLLDQEKAENCKILLMDILSGKKFAYISTFSIDSIVLSMIRNNIENELIIKFLTSLKQYRGLKIRSITLEDRINAVSYIDKYKLDYEDSIILQCAISLKCEKLVSFDKDFDKIDIIKREEP